MNPKCTIHCIYFIFYITHKVATLKNKNILVNKVKQEDMREKLKTSFLIFIFLIKMLIRRNVTKI
jgi:hypothetical protein